MGRPYSQDLRDAVAERFDLSVSCVVKWLQRYHREGSKKPRKIGGYRPLALAEHRVFVLGRLAEKPDLTISALAEELAARGIKVGRFAVWHFLQHERLSFKKNSARLRARSAGRRKTARAVEAGAPQARR